jgi:streptogramin lyase
MSMFPLPPPADLAVQCNRGPEGGGCATSFYYEPRGIVSGPDGNLWATGGLDSIWRITPAGDVTTFHTLGQSSWPSAIAAGSEGNVWVVETTNNPFVLPQEVVARVTPTGTVTESSQLAPQTAGQRLSAGIVPTPSGTLWLGGENFLEKVTATGQATKYSLPVAVSNGVVGPDGNPWFATSKGVLTVARSGHITELGFPGQRYNRVSGIATEPGKALWLLELSARSIVRISIG